MSLYVALCFHVCKVITSYWPDEDITCQQVVLVCLCANAINNCLESFCCVSV